jgi:porphobilinogen synthase
MMKTACGPTVRMRRQRVHPWWREVVAEVRLHPSDLIWPVFLREPGQPDRIETLWDVRRYTVDEVVPAVQEAAALGIPAVALFPFHGPEVLSPDGAYGRDPDNLVCRAIRAIRAHVPNTGVIADVALDPYTTHGHDGIFDGEQVLNDETVEALCQQALTLAQAGAPFVAPSDMMDGRVAAIRQTLDQNGFHHTGIISYGAKCASGLYGPFRDAMGSGSRLGKKDKKTYQIDYRHQKQALQDMLLDMQEGADALMVKPAVTHLDWIQQVASACLVPVLAYHVSGEYMMLKTAARHGVLNYEAVLLETLTAIKRAGARAVITYGAVEAARLLASAP